MSMGISGFLGLGLQASELTGVAPDIFFPATETVSKTFDQLMDENPYGQYDELPSDPGRQAISGQVSLDAYPETLGHLFNALLGGVTEAGGGQPYVHTFKRAAAVSATVARPLYSLQVRKGTRNRRYVDGQCSQVSLVQNAGDRLKVTSDWMFRSQEEGITPVATPSVPTVNPFRFKHAGHELASTDFKLIDNLTLNLGTEIIPENLQDQTELVTAYLLGRTTLTGSMVLSFRDTSVYDDFIAQGQNAWNFKWDISADYALDINVPKLKVISASDPLSGAGRLTATASFKAEYDASLGASFSAILTNDDIDDYTA